MFDKVKLENISYHIEGNNIVFSTIIKDEKQILLASGRIHRRLTYGSGSWDMTLHNILTFTLPFTMAAKSLDKIKQVFNQMVS